MEGAAPVGDGEADEYDEQLTFSPVTEGSHHSSPLYGAPELIMGK